MQTQTDNAEANGQRPLAAARGSATVTRQGALDMQVCVPAEWTDEQVKAFANRENPCGTSHGWQIRREGDKALAGAKERVQCKTLESNVHIMLDA
jgi:hypothetical protein